MLDGTLPPLQPFGLPALTQSEARWEIKRVSKCRPDHLEFCDRLLSAGWEPYGADEYGKHFRRLLESTAPGLIVVRPGFVTQARKLFHGWHAVAAPYGRMKNVPATLDRIVMAWRPNDGAEMRWLQSAIESRLTPPNRLEWLI